MDRKDAIAWVLSVCANSLRLSQVKTLSELVAGALKVSRVSLAQIGRHLLGSPAAKHRIKRTWRFVANERVEAIDAMRGVVRRLLKRHKKKPLLVALDWTDIRGFCTLMAAAVMKGRAVPLVWATYRKWELHRSQNNLEEGLLYVLRSMIPETVKVVLLADRGFGRTELARLCQERLHFHYVIRVSPDVYVRGSEYRGKLLDLPVRRGVCRVLRDVEYRKEEPVRQNVVVRWKYGLPPDRDECWFLMTDLDRSPRGLSELYGQRMTVEEFFRDGKNKRNGWSLRDTLITRPDRIDRLLLILALAYILLVGLGLRARQRFRPSAWCSSNRQAECSDFTIGLIMLDHMNLSPQEAFTAVASATAKAVRGNWG
jgi:hypothetical protein